LKGPFHFLSSSKITIIGLNLFYLIEIALLLIYLLLENVGIDLILIVLVVLISLVSIQKQIFIYRKELNFSCDVIKFDSIHKENHRFFYDFLRILAIMYIFFLIFYLLSDLNYISILLEK